MKQYQQTSKTVQIKPSAKLVVQIPCLNEAETLPLVINSIPKTIPGISSITVLVINDGSSDQTVEVARSLGVTEFIHHTRPQGLGRSFHDGVNRALELGADILVNTDGDNQYPQEKIAELVQPLLAGTADIVVADRQTATIQHFSPGKKWLQKVGSRVVNIAAGTDLPDAASGFRAYSREALLQLNTVTRFSYCTETIIQAGNKRLAIGSIPIVTNPKTRESRLFKSTPEHVVKSGVTILRAYIMYKPYIILGGLGIGLFILGLVPFIRFMYLELFTNDPGNHIQSLLLGIVLIMGAFLALAITVVADLIRINRILHEDQLEHIRRSRYAQ